ncbi:MAG: hypothetical protein VYA07_00735, partial [Candidatus Thermoplasmatota archaeon]|nr:hypothetical protein [Candidatus Thermoplasmatota archaeon]
SAMTKTAHRAESTDFSRSYYTVGFGVLASEASPSITSVDDLNTQYMSDPMESYCLNDTGMTLSKRGFTDNCPSGSTAVFYDEEDDGTMMDGVAGVVELDMRGSGEMGLPIDLPYSPPELKMNILDTNSVLGSFSENAGKGLNIELYLTTNLFFPEVSAKDSHTFVIDPEVDEEFLEGVISLQVSPPSGYTIAEGSKEAVSPPYTEMTWTFKKVKAPPVEEPPVEKPPEEETDETIEEEEIVEVLEDSGLPGPGLLVVLLTILGVASVRRRF